jgi:thiamine-phosphate pyrophosphorylase
VTDSKMLKGLYLVVAPILPFDGLLIAVEKALKGGVDVLQFIPENGSLETSSFAKHLLNLTRQYGVPFLVNGELELMQRIKADGMHFDTYDMTPSEIRQRLGERCIVGYTLGNDLERLKWAENVGADYVSFCSIFPTSSATQCEIVPIQTVKTARARTTLPIFAAGGINLHNARLVLEAGADGIAVISAVLRASDPEQIARSFKEIIRRYRTHIS